MTVFFRRLGGLLMAVVVMGFASCGSGGGDDDGYLYFSVSPAMILFSESDASQNVIEINSNSAWTATVSNKGLVLNKMNGKSGRQTVTVTAMEEGKSYTATFTSARNGTDGKPVVRTVTVSTGTFGWVELPETKKPSSNYKYIRHFSKSVKTNKEVRNYTACYDTRRHNPMYVAFPYHAIYREGGFARTTPDPWRPDPQMTEAQQSIIYRSDWAKWPWTDSSSERYSLWANYPFKETQNGGNYYSRGHMMRSAERGGAGSELNIQTFYPTNIAPERYKYYSHWSDVEGIMPDNWMCADTIYCVVGCHYASDNYTTYDAASGAKTTSGVSKKVVIPTARYKVFLRTKSGNTGKRIAQCTADEVMGIGFWFEQNFGAEIPEEQHPSLKTVIYSIEDIEKMTGNIFNFFPEAPAGVKSSYNIADWPKLSEIAK